MKPFNRVRLPHADIRILRGGHVVRPIDLAHAWIGALGRVNEWAGLSTSTRGHVDEVLAAPAKGR